ncbi:MAG: hypothetical protein AAFO04_18085 [Cyanobacteria bacterium J06592_8]
MAIFRQYIAPLLVVLIFLLALVAVSARIFLPGDLAEPAPIVEVSPTGEQAQVILNTEYIRV